jgi:hypothetical protein
MKPTIVKVKIKDKKTGAIKEVKKSLVSDYIGTGNFELVQDKKEEKKSNFYNNDK